MLVQLLDDLQSHLLGNFSASVPHPLVIGFYPADQALEEIYLIAAAQLQVRFVKNVEDFVGVFPNEDLDQLGLIRREEFFIRFVLILRFIVFSTRLLSP